MQVVELESVSESKPGPAVGRGLLVALPVGTELRASDPDGERVEDAVLETEVDLEAEAVSGAGV